MCLLIPIMKSPIKSNRRISLSRDAPFSWLCSVCSTSVSMHAPRAGCDIAEVLFNTRFLQFQSTHPGRGATIIRHTYNIKSTCFNPRTPSGVRLLLTKPLTVWALFQSTHPRAGCDYEYKLYNSPTHGFNPRTPGRGATETISFKLSGL